MLCPRGIHSYDNRHVPDVICHRDGIKRSRTSSNPYSRLQKSDVNKLPPFIITPTNLQPTSDIPHPYLLLSPAAIQCLTKDIATLPRGTVYLVRVYLVAHNVTDTLIYAWRLTLGWLIPTAMRYCWGIISPSSSLSPSLSLTLTLSLCYVPP